ncbi:nucleoside 2-deoxyribosyltransferase [Variovorax sp.]|uniref:nucleoside 2-deoxyribosyltransferase n=1 Tax=Variovorax sp. TaxID=1871043 RepID=UPI003BA94CE9
MTAPVLIYLAGPHVFEVDARGTRSALEQTCERHNLVGIWPADVDAPAGETHPQRAQRIFQANIDRLRSARGVLADLRPFRGAEPDSGTVFEVGMAFALGIPVVAYGVPPGDYASRVATALPVEVDVAGVLRDRAGLAVEDFGLPLNLMLACAVAVVTTADEAAAELARILLPASPA